MPDPTHVTEFSEMGQPPDLDSLGLSINDATKDAWIATREAFLADSANAATATDSRDLTPGNDLRSMGTVVGVGLGSLLDDGQLAEAPGAACVALYTAEPVPTSTAINYMRGVYGVTALDADEAYVRAVHTGPIDLLAHRFRMRPAPGGVSVGHRDVTAGTLGCLCRGRQAPRDGLTLVLSNNHVLANVNQGASGDPVYQSGPYDGGAVAANQIGSLERFVRIRFDRNNVLDCATAEVDGNDVRSDLVFINNGTTQFFNVALPTVQARIDMIVGKSGRTTQLTAGRVSAIGVTINVKMSDGRVARFTNQIAIQGMRGDFSRPGDSGSLVWTWDDKRNPVGLLFAGGNGITFANQIDDVLNALDVDLVV